MTYAPVPADAPPRGEPTVPNRLLAVGDIFGGSFRTLKRSPKIFILMPLAGAAALVFPALGLGLLAVGGARATGEGGRSAIVTMAVLAGLVLGLLALYVLMRLSGAFTIGAYRVTLGEDPSIGQVWREARGIVWRLIVFALLAAVAVVTCFFVLGFGIFAAAAAGESGSDNGSVAAILVTVLLFLAAIPLTWFLAVRLIFAFQTMAIEHADPVAAIRRSWALTRGFWWPTFGRLLLLYLAGLPVSIISQGLGAFPMAWSLDPDTRMGGAAVLVAFGAILALLIANFLYQAFSLVYVTIMYLDARRREDVAAHPGWTTPAAGPYAVPYLPQPAAPAGAPPTPGAHFVPPVPSPSGTTPASGTASPSPTGATAPYPSAPGGYPSGDGTAAPYPPAGPLWARADPSGGMPGGAITEALPSGDRASAPNPHDGAPGEAPTRGAD